MSLRCPWQLKLLHWYCQIIIFLQQTDVKERANGSNQLSLKVAFRLSVKCTKGKQVFFALKV